MVSDFAQFVGTCRHVSILFPSKTSQEQGQNIQTLACCGSPLDYACAKRPIRARSWVWAHVVRLPTCRRLCAEGRMDSVLRHVVLSHWFELACALRELFVFVLSTLVKKFFPPAARPQMAKSRKLAKKRGKPKKTGENRTAVETRVRFPPP